MHFSYQDLNTSVSWRTGLETVRRKNEQAVTETVAEEPAADEEEIDETDDLALVAVITAALAASLETSPDKLIVRSIRRKSTNRW